jgi:hypothetical protein
MMNERTEMTKKMTYGDVRVLQDSVPTAGMQGHYVLGAYGAMLADLIADLPAKKQAQYVETFARLAERAKQVTA